MAPTNLRHEGSTVLRDFYAAALVCLRELALEARAAVCVEWLDLDIEEWHLRADVNHHLDGHQDPLMPYRLSLFSAQASWLPYSVRPWVEVAFASILGMTRVAAESIRDGRTDMPSANDVLPMGALAVRRSIIPGPKSVPEQFFAVESLVALAVFHLLVTECGATRALARTRDLESLRKSTLAESFRNDLTSEPRRTAPRRTHADWDA